MFKKLFGLLTIAVAGLVFSGVASAQISTTAHDFSGDGWNTTSEICVVCHTPHNADTAVAGAPLWNHEVSDPLLTYTVYSSTTLDAGAMGQPGATSKLCLSCHDGTVAVDSFGGATGGTFISGGALVGTDLSDDHPVSFTYDTTLATTDGGLFDPATANSGLGGTIDADMLFGGLIECASCHEVHDDTFQPFLRINNAGSALCLTCHNK